MLMVLKGASTRSQRREGQPRGRKTYKGPKHPLPRRWSKSGRHRRKLAEQRRGRPKKQLSKGEFRELQERMKRLPDKRAEAVEWAKERREMRRRMLEDVPRLRVLFDNEYLGWFEGSFRHWEKTERGLRLSRERTKEEIVAEATKQALFETFGGRISNLEKLYDQFRAETGNYKFEDFQQWAKGMMQASEQMRRQSR